MTMVVLIISTILQLAAAAMAFSMLKVPGIKRAWLLISSALLLMAIRRIAGMASGTEAVSHAQQIMELIALVISVLMLLGVYYARKLFLKMQKCISRQRALADIVEHTSDLVGSMNPHYQIEYLNPAGRKALGIGLDDDITKFRIQDFHSPEISKQIIEEVLPTAMANEIWQGDMRLKPVDRDAEINISQVVIAHPPINGKIPLYSTVARDITERLQLQQQLRELSESREQLLAILAHDLRGPMGSAMALMEALIADLNHLKPDQLEESLKLLCSALRENYELMESLLLWTRAQVDRLDLAPGHHSLAEIVAPSVQLLQYAANQKRIRIEAAIAAELRVLIDRNICELIVRNLLSNAIKFSPSGSRVIVEAQEDEDLVRLSIKDNGIGINSAKIAYIQEGKPVSSERGSGGELGTGLGLSLCSQFLKKHQSLHPDCGMDVSSVAGQGTTITLRLPKANVAA